MVTSLYQSIVYDTSRISRHLILGHQGPLSTVQLKTLADKFDLGCTLPFATSIIVAQKLYIPMFAQCFKSRQNQKWEQF